MIETVSDSRSLHKLFSVQNRAVSPSVSSSRAATVLESAAKDGATRPIAAHRWGEVKPDVLVAQVSKPAVSPISKSADRGMSPPARTWKSALQARRSPSGQSIYWNRRIRSNQRGQDTGMQSV
jgi:hypothetical protein